MDSTTSQTSDAAGPVGLDITPGARLGIGRDAEVFALGDDRVLRRYRDGSRGADGKLKTSEREAEIMRYVRSRGYPVPAIHAVSGPDMVMDRVDGPTMLKDLGSRPWMVWRHARLLARLHRRLHTIAAPEWVPAFAAHPAFAGDGTGPHLPDPGRPHPPTPSPLRWRGEVYETPGETVLHLDLHPDNVILSRRGPVVIDWRNSRRGEGAIDVATTWLIMATSEIEAPALERWPMEAIRRLFVRAFVQQAGRAAAARQIPSVARYRLADRNLRASEKPAIQRLVHQVSDR